MPDDEVRKKVDADWKARAAAEKEILQQSGAPGADKERDRTAPLGEASFATLVTGLRVQALAALGLVEDPVTGETQPDRDHAKFVIDTLAVLEEKTRGNLAPEEKALLDTALFELRMSFVRM